MQESGTVITSALTTSITDTASSSATRILTDNSGALPDADEVLNKINDMYSSINSRYENSVHGGRLAWFCSTSMANLIRQQTTTSQFAFDPSMKIETLYGHPFIRTDHLDTGTSDGEVVLIFGNLNCGLDYVVSDELQIRSYLERDPGMHDWRGSCRHAASIRDADAIVGLEIGT